MTKNEAEKLLSEKCNTLFGSTIKNATKKEAYRALSRLIFDILEKKNQSLRNETKNGKEVYYLSMEFLVGTSLKNNLFNLGLADIFDEIMRENGHNLNDLYKMEPDAGLGNGGLGRLASCYMDAATTHSLPFTGFSIRYEFGIFRQKIVDGWQMEFPDDWLSMGDVWLKPRPQDAMEVKFGGYVSEWTDEDGFHAEHKDAESVIAVPYDMFISGYDSPYSNRLVLWSAKSPSRIDMSAFSRGEYVKALEENTKAEVISKVLYPADDHIEGKRLRIRQQYFFVSASIQTIINKHLKNHKDIFSLPKKAAIHINDTHPSLAVPELMRILLDEHGLSWDDAWRITTKTLSYTNHTVMQEALEKWNEEMFKKELPRIYQLICEINRRLMETLYALFPDDHGKRDYMAIMSSGQIKMANLCLAACHKTNGVSALHTEILKTGIFRDYYNLAPEKFINITNGIAHRRWLCQANGELTTLLKDLIGDGFLQNGAELSKLLAYKDDKAVLKKLSKIKENNKKVLAKYIAAQNGVLVDESSIFDVQIKRLHEYKRQLLNALHILHLYLKIKENPNLDMQPRTFIFAAKASSGYFMAKQIIRLIARMEKVINADPAVRDKLKVVFIEDYKVSLAEIIIPASEISEQISVAGKEASGTGNMKLMINGAVTLGTLDGANVEIFEAVGRENIFLFGMTADEVSSLWQKGYEPANFVRENKDLRAVINLLTSGALGEKFDEIVASLLTNRYGTADQFMTLADFESYKETQEKVAECYMDKKRFMNMSLINIANAGIFSADRAITEYRNKIWQA